jgi:methyltransferase
MAFSLFIGFIIVQRLTELGIARKNEGYMKNRGALEFGQGHYKWMILIHTVFILSTIIEVLFINRELSRFWPIFLTFFFLIQGMRVWALMSLGTYWNTKIIVMPGAKVVKKGPYRYIKHPNYLVVTLELMIIPMLFNAWLTAIIFSCLNILILSIRIPIEERALTEWGYNQYEVQENGRFFPDLLNKYDNS